MAHWQIKTDGEHNRIKQQSNAHRLGFERWAILKSKRKYAYHRVGEIKEKKAVCKTAVCSAHYQIMQVVREMFIDLFGKCGIIV